MPQTATMRTVYDMEEESRRYAASELRVIQLDLAALLEKLDIITRRELAGDNPADTNRSSGAVAWSRHASAQITDAHESLALARRELMGR